MYIHVILAGEASQKKKKEDNNKVKTTVWPPLLPIKPLFPACFCGYSLMFSYIQRSLQNNILSNIEEAKNAEEKQYDHAWHVHTIIL